MKIGFIGLGIMGKPMAINLAKKGYDLQVYDLNAANVGAVAAAGAAACASVAEACAGADVIITMLPNSPQVEDVVLSPGGVLESAQPGALLVDMSSINPMVSISLEQKLAEKGLRMLDAPVSGGEPKAVDGTLSIMCGGRQEDFDQVRELLLCMGASAVLVGKIGSGNTAKPVSYTHLAADGHEHHVVFAAPLAQVMAAGGLDVRAGLAQFGRRGDLQLFLDPLVHLLLGHVPNFFFDAAHQRILEHDARVRCV